MKAFSMVMKTGLWIIAFLLMQQVQACETESGAEQGCIYKDRGIQFSYPHNWSISDEGSGWLIGPSYVFVEHEESGIVILMIYSNTQAEPLDKFAQGYSNEARSGLLLGSFEEGVFSPQERQLESQVHQGLKETFDMLFMEERLPHTREYYAISSSDKTIFVIMQVADEDMEEGHKGLNRILGSLRFQTKG
ncbi:hypothetical protein [Marinicella sp. W31]|uniref:hypothetical protein n=1 Tax=Marinicella sp. W31 TaxID=3023713 RepID=UPI0037573490